MPNNLVIDLNTMPDTCPSVVHVPPVKKKEEVFMVKKRVQ